MNAKRMKGNKKIDAIETSIEEKTENKQKRIKFEEKIFISEIFILRKDPRELYMMRKYLIGIE